jgi:GNAT superfamily N-acetyltransferase
MLRFGSVEELRIARVSPGLTWRAFDGPAVDSTAAVGEVRAFLKPDGRWVIGFDDCRDDAYQPLLAAVADGTGGELYATANEKNGESQARFADLGFVVNRREGIYLIPTDPELTGLAKADPGETVLISAIDADWDDLRLLDDALRQDVPGSDGWQWDPAGFREETYDASDFDPATYVVAVDSYSARYIGLARVWVGPGRPRLGLVAVLPPYRRRGLARAMLSKVFGVLHERGKAEVTCEIDDTSTASLALLTGIGAHRIAGMVEFKRQA